MKKIIAFLFVCTILFFVSCDSYTDPKDTIVFPLKVTAKLNGSDDIFTADIFEGGCDVTFDSSHPFSSIELKLRDDGNTATSGDFNRTVANGTFPVQEALVKAFRSLEKTEILGTETENGIKYTIDEMNIMVYYDKSAKLITGIETEEGGRRFDFTVIGLELYEGQSSSEG